MKKEITVVRFDTNKPSQLTLQGGKQLILEEFLSGGNRGRNQHLYFLSDDVLKLGDYFINTIQYEEEYYKAHQCTDETFVRPDIHKKIIGTTDESLNLPSPPQWFLKRYCELGGIDKVSVIYQEERNHQHNNHTSKFIPLIWSNNILAIKLIENKQKKTFTINDMKEAFNAGVEYGCEVILEQTSPHRSDIKYRTFEEWLNSEYKKEI